MGLTGDQMGTIGRGLESFPSTNFSGLSPAGTKQMQTIAGTFGPEARLGATRTADTRHMVSTPKPGL